MFFFCQVAEGLAFLHKFNIVYRDLKPSNILIFSLALGIQINAKIADYGISQYTTPMGLAANQGTPGYRAPEVARGDTGYNTEVDIFSFGVTLYELVTGGTRPFGDLPYHNELDAAVLTQRALDPVTAYGCPPWPDVQDLIQQCLHVQPGKKLPRCNSFSLF